MLLVQWMILFHFLLSEVAVVTVAMIGIVTAVDEAAVDEAAVESAAVAVAVAEITGDAAGAGIKGELRQHQPIIL